MDKILGTPFSSEGTKKVLTDEFGLALSENSYEVKFYSDGTKYLCFYSEGISIGLDAKSDIVDVVDFYKFGQGRYKPLKNKALVPRTIGYDTTPDELLRKNGEPTEKGGGTKDQRIDIWVRWPSFEITVKSKNWDQARDAPWSTLSCYRP